MNQAAIKSEISSIDEFNNSFRGNFAMKHTVIMGAGPAGLTAGLMLTRNQEPVTVIEKGKSVGGLAKTIEWKGYRVDYGGHRFFTKNRQVHDLVLSLIKDELVNVKKISRIYLNGKYFNYPLEPANALLSLGAGTTIIAGKDYVFARVKDRLSPGEKKSFEGWTKSRFGWKLYELFFKNYTEKVWGIPCTQLSSDFADQRIRGLSIVKMVRRAVFPKKKKIKSLIEEFIYPRMGYGVIWEKMKDEVLQKKGSVMLESEVTKVNHDGKKIISIEVKDKNGTKTVTGDEYISTIPLTELVKKLSPAPSKEVLEACEKLKFRDWIGITYVINKKRITSDTWLYVPDPSLKFGRIQQWANWSEGLIQGDHGSLMLEYFVFEGDKTWNMSDADLLEFGKKELCDQLKFMKREDILDGFVLRARKTYPVYAMGYEQPLELVKGEVKKFSNLQIIGRYGTFRYNNADHSIEMGIQAADKILGRPADPDAVNKAKEYQEEIEEDTVD